MNTFNIDIKNVKNSSQALVNMKNRMNTLRTDVESIRLAGIVQTNGSEKVEQVLRQLAGKLLEECVRMDLLGKALFNIAEQYQKAEDNIIFTGDVSGRYRTGPYSEYFFRWLRNRLIGRYDTSQVDMEAAADRAMHDSLSMILQDERYSPEYLRNASMEEREEIAQEYVNAVIIVYGLQNVVPEIDWFDEGPNEQGITLLGCYNPDKNIFSLNKRFLEKDMYTVLSTIGHELRHAYQDEAVHDHPWDFYVSEGTLESWRENMIPDNYIDANVDFRGYENQPIERDAREFEVSR